MLPLRVIPLFFRVLGERITKMPEFRIHTKILPVMQEDVNTMREIATLLETNNIRPDVSTLIALINLCAIGVGTLLGVAPEAVIFSFNGNDVRIGYTEIGIPEPTDGKTH